MSDNIHLQYDCYASSPELRSILYKRPQDFKYLVDHVVSDLDSHFVIEENEFPKCKAQESASQKLKRQGIIHHFTDYFKWDLSKTQKQNILTLLFYSIQAIPRAQAPTDKTLLSIPQVEGYSAGRQGGPTGKRCAKAINALNATSEFNVLPLGRIDARTILEEGLEAVKQSCLVASQYPEVQGATSQTVDFLSMLVPNQLWTIFNKPMITRNE